jgi:hypothetical protein
VVKKPPNKLTSKMIIASAVESKYGIASQGNAMRGRPADISDATFRSLVSDPTVIKPSAASFAQHLGARRKIKEYRRKLSDNSV